MTRGAATRPPLLGILATLAGLTMITSCTTPLVPRPTQEASCPAGWRAAVVFSSQIDTESDLAFLGPDSILERRRLPYQGFSPAPGSVRDQNGTDVWLAANGNVARDTTHLVHFSTATCGIDAFQVPEPVIRSVITTPDGGVVSSNSPVSGAEVRWRTARGTLVADTTLPDLDITAWEHHGTELIGIGTEVPTDQTVVVQLSTPSLTETRRVVLPGMVSPGRGTAIIGNSLYYTESTGPGDAEGTVLANLDLDTFVAEPVARMGPSPFLIAQAPDSLYVANTFVNPGFRPMAEYRTVSRFMLDTKEVTTFEVGGPLLDIALAGKELIVAAGDEKGANVSRFDRFTGQRLGQIHIPAPPGKLYYLANLILAPPPNQN